MEITELLNKLTKEKLETVKAFAYALSNGSMEGIQVFRAGLPTSWESRKRGEELFSIYRSYRIKPTQKLIPFNFSNADDYLSGHGFRFKDHKSSAIYYPTSFHNTYIRSGEFQITYEDLLTNCEFLDSSPCGKVSDHEK